MVSFTAIYSIAVGVLVSLAAASPRTARPKGRDSYNGACPSDGSVSATLFGAAGAEFNVQIPCSGVYTPITNPLSISQIQTSAGPCTFLGIDGGSLSLAGAAYSDFGPPQTIVGAFCGYVSY